MASRPGCAYLTLLTRRAGASPCHVYGPAGERDEDGQQNAQGSTAEPGDGYADGQEVSPGKWPEGLGDAPASAVRRQVSRAGDVIRQAGHNGVRRSEQKNLA